MRVRALQKAGKWSGLILLLLLHAVAAQTPSKLDTVLTYIEVDQLPRSDSVSTPVAAFDARGNFTVAWVAYDQGLTQILLRYFDAIGRPLTEIRSLTDRTDTLAVAHPDLAFTPEGLLWVAWDQTTLRGTTTAVAQVLNRDLKPVNKAFAIEANPEGSTSRPRVVCSATSRVITAWILETRPAYVKARYFKVDGSADSDAFFVDQSGDENGVGDRLGMAVSSRGVVAMAWRGQSNNKDHINFRSFDNPQSFLDNKKDIPAPPNVGHPALAFVSVDQLIVQWYALEGTALLRAQRFDVLGEPLAAPFDITALDFENTPVVVNASEQQAFVSFWSQRDLRDQRFSNVSGQVFTAAQQPATKVITVARTPNANTPLEIASAISPAGNYLAVYTGNDGDRNSLVPRIGALLTQAALPDLQLQSLELAPANPTHGDSVKIRWMVQNAGLAPAAASSAMLEFINTGLDTVVAVPPLPVNGTAKFEINMGILAPGNYTLRVTLDYTLEIAEQNEQNNTAGFPFKVDEAPRLMIEPAFLNFNATFGQPNPADRVLNLSNAGSDTVRWRVAVDQPWLQVSPATGILAQSPATDQINVRVNTASLQVGTFSANLLFTSNGGDLTIPVSLTVAPALPSLLLQPPRLDFAATQGGANPPEQSFTIQNRGSGTLTWSLTSNQPWISVVPASGTTTLEIDQIATSVILGNLLPGSYLAKIFVASNGGEDSVEVALSVSPQPPLLQASPTLLNFVTTAGTSNPPAQAVYIRNTGGGTLEWSLDENVDWISVSPRSGQTRANTDSVRVISSITSLVEGDYSEFFTINSNGGAQQVRVHFIVNPRPVFSDLTLQTKSVNLESCYTSDYRYLASFVVYNLGDAAASATIASLLVDGQVVQQLPVPALQPGGTFDLAFAAQPLSAGYHTISCEVDSAALSNEINRSNNSVTLQEWVAQKGDANRDSVIDLRDLSYLVDLVLERVTDPPRREIWSANVVIDTLLNVADIVKMVDMLLGESLTESAYPASPMTVRVEQVAASRTRLSWQTSLQLQGWQLRWQLTQAQTDQPLQSARFGGCEIYWRVRHNELSAMIWPVLNSRAAADLRMGEVELPFALVAPDLRAALGVIEDGQMLRLQPQTTMEELGPPQAFLLSSAFPNPLRRMQHGTVAWRYALPEAATVEFRIFNMLGQELRRVHLGEQPAGRGQWQWDGRDQAGRSLASGVYFVEFSAGRFKQRERVLLR